MGFRGFKKSKEKGQASILMGIMMLTFVIFFAFVINIGSLVNAKINLQNAADLAAYAGAATQARQLNQIAYLNYEMRRQYKKFLFNYYVLGNMAQQGFPSPGTQGTPYAWKPNSTSPYNYQIPAVCVIFNPKDDYCQAGVLPEITVPPAGPAWDEINAALVSQLTQLEQLRESDCSAIDVSNLLALDLWLFNADPTLKSLTTGPAANSNADSAAIITRLKGYVNSVGLIPREAILMERIKTLATYVNTPALPPLTFETASKLQGGKDPSNERAIQAFFSAYETLGSGTFSGDITMTELLPKTLLQLNPITIDFDTYSLGLNLDGKSNPSPQNPVPCTPQLNYFTLDGVPVGFEKDPSTLTYYAVRVEADAKLLFYPSFFGGSTIHLKAYAAAQPFGSRIGPAASAVTSTFTTPYNRSTLVSQNLLVGSGIDLNAANVIPNLTMIQGNNLGWDDSFILLKMFQQLGSTPNPGADQVIQAMSAAMAPTLLEAPLYNIPNSFFDAFVEDFDGPNGTTQPLTSFWAPIAPAGADPTDTVDQDIIQIFHPPKVGAAVANAAPNYTAMITKAVNQYINELQSPTGGEDGETVNVVFLQNPTVYRPGSGPGGVISLDPSFSASTAAQIKTSWDQPQGGGLDPSTNVNYRAEGRVGYSVKFVSFDTLTNANEAAHVGASKFTNMMILDGDAQGDVPMIKH